MSSTNTITFPAGTEKILNVFFHGLFVFLDRPGGIDILLPKVKQHSYRAGCFLGETLLIGRPIAKPYVLEGVQRGHAHFDETKCLLVKNMPIDPGLTEDQVYAAIWAPTPLRIVPFQSLDLKPYLNRPDLFACTNAAMQHVFQYRFTGDANTIKLGHHPFLQSAEVIGGHDYMSLHIFSEEDFTPDTGHPIHGFEAAANVFPGLRGKVTMNPSIPVDQLLPIKAKDILRGTILPEYEDLSARTEMRLRILGQAMREGKWPPFSGDFLGTDVSTCTGIVGK